MRRALALMIIAAAAVVAAPTIASGGVDEDELIVELESPVEPLTFTAAFDDGTCVDGEFDTLVEANNNEVTPVSVTQNSGDPDLFTIVLPSNTPPGELDVDIECDDGDGTTEEHGSVLWASIPVTKVVVGTVLSTTQGFTVKVDCQSESASDEPGPVELPEDFTAFLQFGVSGGLKYVYTDHPGLCAITETNTGGATSVTISPDVVDTSPAPAAYPVTVTNTFVAPVAAQPNFTG
jgi:hypothetical protein